MPKSVRRIQVQRTVTYQATFDVSGYPEETEANLLALLGGAAGQGGQLANGELLAQAGLVRGGNIVKSNWSAVANSMINVEPYGLRIRKQPMSVGMRVIAAKPPVGYEGALAKQFIVSVAGTTADVDTEPNWSLTDGSTTTDGTVVYRTIPRYPTLVSYAQNTAYTLGTVLRPSNNSMKEYLVIGANSASAQTPNWTTADTLGAAVSFQTGGQAICIAGCSVYVYNQLYMIGDVVKPSASSTQEYLCTGSGTSGTDPITLASVGLEGTFGSAKFKRMV